MNKTKLQQELLQKIKPGVKPSELKKNKNTNGEKAFHHDILISPSHQLNNTPASSPPASPIIVPVDKKSQPKPPISAETAKQIKQLQEQVNFHANTANNYLTNLQ